MTRVPLFAIIGHPNEGKSSVVSTLTEDDSVVVSAYPGETVECRRFPVKLNGEILMEFVDTPGFQNPTRILDWMKNSGLRDSELLRAVLKEFSGKKEFLHDHRLLTPLSDGAGIIYVVDASRPLLEVDEAEMEVLRLVNNPRMAIINAKDSSVEYLEAWKNSLRRHFNVIREFNAHSAVYTDRRGLLEALKAVHQDWEPMIQRAIDAYQSDWDYRKARVCEAMIDALEEILSTCVELSYTRESDTRSVTEKANQRYREKISKLEEKLFKRIRHLYRHNLYDFELPAHSVVQEDLFSENTWQLLGLTQKQLLVASTAAGAGVGVALDIAASGLTFGVFTAAGALTAGAGVLLKGKELGRLKIQSLPLGGSKVVVGPNKNPQFPFVLLDRMLIYYSEVANHAHGKRVGSEMADGKVGFTSKLDGEQRKKLANAFRKLESGSGDQRSRGREVLGAILDKLVESIV